MMEITFSHARTVAENLAMDESVARNAWDAGTHLLRFWWGGPPAVVMGSSEHPEQVAHVAECTRYGVSLLKRCSGGGTVLQTKDVLNYSLITPAPASLDVRASFCQGTEIIRAILARFGIVGVPQGTSDVAVGDRKISGNAQAWRWKSLLVHGTLLVDFDFDLAEKLLKHPPREPDYRRGRNHRDFLVTLRALGVRASRGEIETAAILAAEKIFGSVKPHHTLPSSYPPSSAILS
jgi:lipoate-protein ligase A